MTSDGWSLVRSRLGRLLGRGDARAEAAALDTLDEDAQAMAGASGDTAAVAQELSTQWSVRLRDVLRVDPDAAVVFA